jgi:hypothetical protein
LPNGFILNQDFFPRALPPSNPAPAPCIPAPVVFPEEDLAPPVLGIRELDGLGAAKPPSPKLDPNAFLVSKFEPNDFGAVKPPPPIEPHANPSSAPASSAVLIFDLDLLRLVNPPAPNPVVEAGFGAENDVPPIKLLVLLLEPKVWVG